MKFDNCLVAHGNNPCNCGGIDNDSESLYRELPGLMQKLLDEKDEKIKALEEEFRKAVIWRDQKVDGLEKELALSRSAVRRLREALSETVKLVRRRKSNQYANSAADEIVKRLLQETALFEAESTKPENLESGK